MGIDTNLYISKKYSVRDIVSVIENHGIGTNVTVESGSSKYLESCPIHFMTEKGPRGIFVYLDADTPLGPAISISLRYNKEGVAIMRAIANVLGGFLEEQDSAGQMEMIRGAVWEEDGVPYFLKEALIAGAMKDGGPEGIDDVKAYDDIDGLVQFIKDWKKKHNK